jgi:hypothetical protein
VFTRTSWARPKSFPSVAIHNVPFRSTANFCAPSDSPIQWPFSRVVEGVLSASPVAAVRAFRERHHTFIQSVRGRVDSQNAVLQPSDWSGRKSDPQTPRHSGKRVKIDLRGSVSPPVVSPRKRNARHRSETVPPFHARDIRLCFARWPSGPEFHLSRSTTYAQTG